MTLPVVTVEVAFTTDPGNSLPSWEDVTAYVRQFSTHRGRQTELDRIEAGTATVVFDNRTAVFNPNNSAGAHYGFLKPMRRIRISATYGATTYPVFTGLVQSWPQEYPGSTDATSTVRCVDLFRSLNLNAVSASYSSELSGTRVGHVLTSAGWPLGSDFRDIDAGQSTLQASTLDGSALGHLQDVALSEGGLFFIARGGAATFIDRLSLLTATLDTSLTWGDTGSYYRYLDIEFLDADVTLWNDIDVTAPTLTTQTATDSTSQTSFFPRNLSLPTLIGSTGEMLDRANYALARYKDPATRVSRMVVSGMLDTTQWPLILAREIGDKVRVRRTPRSGDVIVQDSVIEGIEFTAVPGSWTAAWALSPADGSTDYWIFDTSTFGETTRFAY